MNDNHSTNTSQSSAPKGLQQTSPGQRPGFVVQQFFPSPERAKQGDAICAALSGFDRFFATLSQGVALGWFVVAAPGRHRTRSGQRSLLCTFAFLLFLFGSPLFAANSPLADAAEKSDSATIRTLLKQHAAVNA